MTTGSADAPTPSIEGHDVHCRLLLKHAAEMIAQGDRRGASEQLWSAAARRIEALAAARGWPYQGLADGRGIARYVANHADNQQIGTLFMVALDAHQNVYDDDWEDEEFVAALREVCVLIDLLDAAERELPPDLGPPTARHYQRRHGLAHAAESD